MEMFLEDDSNPLTLFKFHSVSFAYKTYVLVFGEISLYIYDQRSALFDAQRQLTKLSY